MNLQTNTFTILIVDDIPSNLSVVVDLLEEGGYNVAVAQDGEEGLQRAQLVLPDLILLDVMLPGADGFEICRRLKAEEKTRDIPVIFMTALVAAEHKVIGFKAGGVDYVTKPLQIDEVVARVGTHLKLRAAKKRLEEQNAQLQAYQQELERRVAERTAELSGSNQQLRMEIAERRRTEQSLEESRTQLRTLTAKRDEAREDERKRIAREIHDELGQLLNVLRLNATTLDFRFGDANADLRTKAQSMVSTADRAILMVRNLATRLRPAVLSAGIVSALDWLVQEYAENTGIVCMLHKPDEDIPLDEDRAMLVFRIVQESLTNALRHSGANRIDITIGDDADMCEVEVRDNGKGFDPDSACKGNSLGIVGMRERALILGGDLDIVSEPGAGTVLTLRIPLAEFRQ
ncbi:MAG: response regulator [Methylobacter sp.]